MALGKGWLEDMGFVGGIVGRAKPARFVIKREEARNNAVVHVSVVVVAVAVVVGDGSGSHSGFGLAVAVAED